MPLHAPQLDNAAAFDLAIRKLIRPERFTYEVTDRERIFFGEVKSSLGSFFLPVLLANLHVKLGSDFSKFVRFIRDRGDRETLKIHIFGIPATDDHWLGLTSSVTAYASYKITAQEKFIMALMKKARSLALLVRINGDVLEIEERALEDIDAEKRAFSIMEARKFLDAFKLYINNQHDPTLRLAVRETVKQGAADHPSFSICVDILLLASPHFDDMANMISKYSLTCGFVTGGGLAAIGKCILIKAFWITPTAIATAPWIPVVVIGGTAGAATVAFCRWYQGDRRGEGGMDARGVAVGVLGEIAGPKSGSRANEGGAGHLQVVRLHAPREYARPAIAANPWEIDVIYL